MEGFFAYRENKWSVQNLKKLYLAEKENLHGYGRIKEVKLT